MASSNALTSRLGAGLSFGIILNIFLPKGGFYAAGLPLTWGYLILMPATVWGVIGLFFRGHVGAIRLLAFSSCLPFIGIAALTLYANGAEQLSFVIALFVTFGFLPFALYIALDDVLPREKVEVALRFVAAGFFYVALWGIVGFVFAAAVKTPLDIPFITTGGGSELSSIDRNNLRGDLYKLTSTFNNGNVYGVCCLMLLPIVANFMPRWKTNIVKLSILLTLSRSAWAGLVFYEIGHAIFVRRKRGALKYLLVMLAAVAVLVSLVLYALGTDTTFLLSTDLGGRLHIYEDIGEILPFSVQRFDTIYEIVYPSILGKFGYLGLGAFLMAMLAPLWLRYITPRPFDDLDRSIAFGMIIYLMMCWSDGALLYIPSMLFYLSLATSLLSIPSREKYALEVSPALNGPATP
jgi:hypothetical protein